MSSSVIYGVLFFTIVLSSFLSSGVSANCQDAIERGLSIFQVNEPTEGDLNSCRSAGSEFFVVKFAILRFALQMMLEVWWHRKDRSGALSNWKTFLHPRPAHNLASSII